VVARAVVRIAAARAAPEVVTWGQAFVAPDRGGWAKRVGLVLSYEDHHKQTTFPVGDSHSRSGYLLDSEPMNAHASASCVRARPLRTRGPRGCSEEARPSHWIS